MEHAKIHDTTVAKQNLREIKRDLPIVCPYCKRMLLCSARFSHRVTLLAHFVKFHRLSPEDVQDFTSKCATWNLTREFPYIDPALSIKLGKLQCAICEASLPDTAQILKHATIVHEGYKPNSAAEELVMEAGSSDMTLEWAGSTAEVQHPVRSTSFETFSDEKIFSKFSQTSEVTVSASAPLECTSQEAASGVNIDFTHSAEGKDEALFTVVTPKKELLSSSGRRLSRSYAPMNDRVPQLPSSSDDEVIREGGKSAITSTENLNSQGEARDEQENYEEAACTSKREG
ncbi:unnamed protein product [Cylicostephanus goldi]|uniref:C2H2-type domain-containing protein n=1 Tax=Cylicostephanus goldi TaxID=71465 RepID=A0A3P7NBS7_CYLGO|nr:unnamed protein product [Cylicostephanus goldi]